ncbi:hypothetical protein GF367_04265 [Candidatus Woesearchaeota archaeon]|nr:hypothetical protein [Candidatus Woesearchaeota archaeon]
MIRTLGLALLVRLLSAGIDAPPTAEGRLLVEPVISSFADVHVHKKDGTYINTLHTDNWGAAYYAFPIDTARADTVDGKPVGEYLLRIEPGHSKDATGRVAGDEFKPYRDTIKIHEGKNPLLIVGDEARAAYH